jgi:hypothetical protein
MGGRRRMFQWAGTYRERAGVSMKLTESIIPGAVLTFPSAARKRFFLKKKQKRFLVGARGAAALMPLML